MSSSQSRRHKIRQAILTFPDNKPSAINYKHHYLLEAPIARTIEDDYDQVEKLSYQARTTFNLSTIVTLGIINQNYVIFRSQRSTVLKEIPIDLFTFAKPSYMLIKPRVPKLDTETIKVNAEAQTRVTYQRRSNADDAIEIQVTPPLNNSTVLNYSTLGYGTLNNKTQVNIVNHGEVSEFEYVPYSLYKKKDSNKKCCKFLSCFSCCRQKK